MTERLTPVAIRHKFEDTFNGQKNFLTPSVVEYGQRGRCLYEISTGTGIGGRAIYGVTVLDLDGTHRHDLSTSAGSLADAKAHIRSAL